MNGSMSSFLTFSCGQTRKHSLEEEGILPSRGPRGCPQNLSAERELQGACSWVPCCPPCLLSLPFSSWQGAGRGFVSRATFPFFWLVLFFSGTFSSKFSIYSQYFYCFLSFSSPVFSLCLSSSFFPISHFHLLTSKEQKQL